MVGTISLSAAVASGANAAVCTAMLVGAEVMVGAIFAVGTVFSARAVSADICFVNAKSEEGFTILALNSMPLL